MKSHMLLIGLSLCSALLSASPAQNAVVLKPGLAYVFFDDTGFRRPGAHGAEERIKSHGKVVAIKSHGVDRQIDLDIEGVNDFSKLWIGQIKFPASGEVTFVAEADDGLRLFIAGKCIIDGWSRDGAREGKIRVTADQRLPLRVEYFQSGGAAYLRLFWQWQGHARELVPPSAFFHDQKDWQRAQAIAQGKASTAPGNAPPVISVPTGKEEFKSSICRQGKRGREPFVRSTLRAVPAKGSRPLFPQRRRKPIRLSLGPHLFLDDFLIESTKNVKRRVNCPRRDPKIPNPLITGKEDHCVGPYMTVLRDPQTGRFRIWYNVFKELHRDGTARFAYMESDDGIHWIRPHRVIKDPGAINFGCAVIDEGPDFPDRSKRYKLGWWANGGLNIAVSADGLNWTMFRPYPVLRHNHDINNIFYDTLRKRYVATISVYTTGPTWKGHRRTTMMSVSDDLLNWRKPWYVITADDSVDEGQTQFYAMNGYLIRGDLLIGLVKVLRDDLVAPGTPKGAFGVGYTTLAWTRDGEHWVRDLTPFFEPDPRPDAWDHAHAWLDWQLPVGDEVYIYYGGYKYGHKMDRWAGRQIGLVRMPRDRYVARDAGPEGGTLRTPPVVLAGNKMAVNARVRGELRVRLLDDAGKPIPGFDTADCEPVKGDSLAHAIQWKTSLATLGERPVRIEFVLRDAELYGFKLAE